MARKASFINWEEDILDVIDRKLRAFCGQDIGIRLKMEYKGVIRDVTDLEIYHGSFKGNPGDVLGFYTGRGFFKDQPVIRAVDGVAVMRLGKEIIPLTYSSIFYNECPQEKLIAPGKRLKSTSRKIVIKSIKLNQ
jgi:hypothetical protein